VNRTDDVKAESPTAGRPESPRFGPAAPSLYRSAALSAWLALVARLFASSLPGSRSGIDAWIEKSLTVAGVLAQLSVLLGSAALVLLVVATLADSTLSVLYRSTIVPAAAGVLMLVMLAATMGLEPVASLAIGTAALVLVLAGASMAMRAPESRAPGLVLATAGLAAAARLAARALESGSGGPGASAGIVAGLGTASYLFDGVALALAFARFSAELGRAARWLLPALFVLAFVLSWGGIRGSMDGAAHWQVLASRSLSELSDIAGSSAYARGSSLGTRFTLDALGLLLSGGLILSPSAVSVGAISMALVLLARHGLDVPACALAAALGALAAPLATPPRYEEREPAPRRPAPARAAGTTAAGVEP
jgi:hypothetical protein